MTDQRSRRISVTNTRTNRLELLLLLVFVYSYFVVMADFERGGKRVQEFPLILIPEMVAEEKVVTSQCVLMS